MKYKNITYKDIRVSNQGLFLFIEDAPINDILHSVYELIAEIEYKYDEYYILTDKYLIENNRKNETDIEEFYNNKVNSDWELFDDEYKDEVKNKLALVINRKGKYTHDLHGNNYKVVLNKDNKEELIPAYNVEESDKMFQDYALFSIFGLYYFKQGGFKNILTGILCFLSGGLFGLFFLRAIAMYIGNAKENDKYIKVSHNKRNKIILSISFIEFLIIIFVFWRFIL